MAALVVLLVALASGCSGGDDEPGADPSSAPSPASSSAGAPDVDPAVLQAELARVFRGDHSTPDGRREARCFAEGLLDRVDVDDLAAAGLVGADGHVVPALPVLDRELAEHWVRAQEGCVAFLDASVEALSAQTKGGLDARLYRRCLGRSLTEDEMRAAQIAALTGDLDGDEVDVLAQAQRDCAARSLPSD